MINSKQCTVVLYVDGNKVSYDDPVVVIKFIDLAKNHFGNLTVTIGINHFF